MEVICELTKQKTAGFADRTGDWGLVTGTGDDPSGVYSNITPSFMYDI